MESSAVPGTILMIEETVGRPWVSTCLYIFHLSHFRDPVCDTGSLPFLNEHWTNSRLHITERDEDHGY